MATSVARAVKEPAGVTGPGRHNATQPSHPRRNGNSVGPGRAVRLLPIGTSGGQGGTPDICLQCTVYSYSVQFTVLCWSWFFLLRPRLGALFVMSTKLVYF